MTKIVLPKVLQNFKKTPNCTCWPKEVNRKGFFLFSAKHTIPDETEGGPPFQFFRHCETFFEKKIPKGSPPFFGVSWQNGYWKIPKCPLLSFFRHCETFFKTFFAPKGPLGWKKKCNSLKYLANQCNIFANWLARFLLEVCKKWIDIVILARKISNFQYICRLWLRIRVYKKTFCSIEHHLRQSVFCYYQKIDSKHCSSECFYCFCYSRNIIETSRCLLFLFSTILRTILNNSDILFASDSKREN